MNNNRVIARILAAALIPFLIINTLALSAGNSSDDDKSQSHDELPAIASTVAGSNGTTAQVAGETANQHSNHTGSPFTSSFTAIDCLEMTSPEVIEDILQSDSSITCGRVSVPANWQTPNDNKIELALYRLAPTTYSPAPDPVVVLAGGPGQPGVGILSDFIDGDIAYLRERSEVIVVDQRGTGFSIPALVCPAVAAINQADYTEDTLKALEATYAFIEKSLLTCVEDLVVQNISLADYTTANNARDIEAIRQALGFDQWNLFGGSYGTTLALTIIRDWPDGVRSAILDSAAPLQANIMTERTYSRGYWPLSRIVENCKADADCHELIGDIQPLLEAGIARLATSPIGLFDAQRYVMEILARNIGDPILATAIQVVALGSDEDIAHFFDLDMDRANSVTDAQAETVDNNLVPPPIADTPPGLIPTLLADVMSTAVLCAEEFPNSKATASPDISGNFQQTTRDVIEKAIKTETYSDGICNQLGIPPADAIESQAVRSDIPVLILAGDTDIRTPLAWSQRVAETLPHSQYVEFPRAGHVLTAKGFDCTTDLLLSFLDAPEKAVDRTCVDALPLVDYYIRTESETHSASDPER